MGTPGGFALRDLFVAVTFGCMLLAVALLGCQQPGTRRASCSQYLQQIAIALQAYHDQFKTFPPGGVRRGDDPTKTYISVHAILVPFLGASSHHWLYDPAKDWLHQVSGVAVGVIPMFVCPSNTDENPVQDLLLNELVLSPGSGTAYPKDQRLGSTTYVFCKGVTDAWCRGPNSGPPGPPSVPASERGMFDMNWAMRMGQLTDGASRTIAVGEGGGGMGWLVSDTTVSQPNRVHRPGVDKFDNLRSARQAWIGMEPSNASLSAQGLFVSSVFAWTLEPMNKNPVTDSWADITALDDCRKSLPSAPGTKGPTSCGGPHVTPNFRSDHPGGANFLFADGSLHFLNEEIDMLLYQRLSTPMDGIEVDVP